MAERTKIMIGAPTYNSYTRIRDLLTSIQLYTNYNKDDYKIVIVDDGTPDKNIVEQLRQICKDFNVSLIEHSENLGIPAAWNSLTRYYDCEYIILLNDDIQICDPNWLKCMIYFFENNENVGSVGYPLYHMNLVTRKMHPNFPSPNLDTVPGVVGAPVGCAFSFKRSIFDEVNGFWSELFSFHEETDFGFECNRRGYRCYMLPYPPMEHWGSQTFSQNFILSIRKPDEDILPMEQYRKIMFQKYDEKRIEPIPGHVYRMDYSRVMFALKWGCKDLIDNPSIEVHRKLVDPIPKRKVKWLDKNMNEQEAIV